MINHERFIAEIDIIGERIYHKVGFADTFIVFFRHGYTSTDLHDDYLIASWECGGYIFSNYFYTGEKFYIIDNVISITELRRLLNTKICNLL